MNRSSSKADAANASVSRRRVRQLLHAYADDGQPSARGLRLHVGSEWGSGGQKRLRLIGQNRTQTLCSPFRRRRRHPWIANRRFTLAPRSR